MAKHQITLEGFLDSKGLGEFGCGSFLCKPFTRFFESGGTEIESLIDDLGIDLATGDEKAEHEFDGQQRKNIMSAFYKARRRFLLDKDCTNWYFKILLEYDTDEDSDTVYTVLGFDGEIALKETDWPDFSFSAEKASPIHERES